MPLIDVPSFLGPPLVLDVLLNKFHPLHQQFSKQEDTEKENVYIINGQPWQRKTLLGDQRVTIFSATGRALFNDNNNYTLSQFVKDSNICDFDTFLNTIKSGSLEALDHLNFVRNHLSLTDPEGNNALIWAASINATNIMDYLLKLNCPKKQKNLGGYSALDVAAYAGLTDAVTLLVNHGACDYLEPAECSALLLARQQNHEDIIQILENKIAQNYQEYMQRYLSHRIKP